MQLERVIDKVLSEDLDLEFVHKGLLFFLNINTPPFNYS